MLRYGVVAWEREDGTIVVLARTHTPQAARALARIIAKRPAVAERWAYVDAADIMAERTLETIDTCGTLDKQP